MRACPTKFLNQGIAGRLCNSLVARRCSHDTAERLIYLHRSVQPQACIHVFHDTAHDHVLHVNRIAASYDCFAVSGSDAFFHIKEGDGFIRAGDVSAAEASFSAAIRLDQSNKIAYTKRANARSKMGQLGAAVSDLTAALDIEPNSISTRLERAELYLRLCSFQSAENDYNAVLESKADHDGALQGSEKVTAGRAHLETAQVG